MLKEGRTYKANMLTTSSYTLTDIEFYISGRFIVVDLGDCETWINIDQVKQLFKVRPADMTLSKMDAIGA